MSMSRYAYQWVQAVGFVSAAKVAQIFKVSFMLGSYTMFFSLSNSITPLAGAFVGLSGATAVALIKMAFATVFFGGMFPLVYLADYIPGMFAGYYWASYSIVIRALVPMMCMAFFIAHPEGAHAWWYTLYWWIPVTLYFVGSRNIFFEAVGSTFVAHAVGSVIWLYTVSMSTADWAALMPAVIIERTIFALGMVVCYRLYERATKTDLAALAYRFFGIAQI